MPTEPDANILVVDDHPANLLAIEAVLQPLGYRMLRALSADEALAKLLVEEVALIILDVMMPGGNGFELAQILQGRERTRSIPIIFLTGVSTEEHHIRHGYATGAVDYLVKPVAPDILRAKVKFCLKLHLARRVAEIARLEAESAQRRASFLAQASAVLSESLDYSTTLARIANLAVPAVADWCTVTLVQENKPVRTVAVVHRDARKQDLARDYEKRFPPIFHRAGEYAIVLREGKAVLVPEVDDSQLVAAAQSTEHLQLLRELGVRSCIMAPLAAHQNLLGVISFMVAESNRRYGPADLTLVQDLAIRAALAIENAQLYEAERKRADFEQALIGIVSHDLRNPLGVIRLSAAAIEKEIDVDGRHKKLASRIVSATERASRLIRDLLDFTQARMAGGIPIQRRAVDFHVMTRESIEGIRHAHDGRNIELEQSGDGKGEWDPDRIDQVLENLVNNALKYSSPGSAIDVVTKGQNEFVLVQVHNAGDPIPQELLPDIFKPMKRSARKMDKDGRSIGLGLYIVQQIVLAHDGVIEVSSSREQGTTFTVRLPRKAQSVAIHLMEPVGPTIQPHSSVQKPSTTLASPQEVTPPLLG